MARIPGLETFELRYGVLVPVGLQETKRLHEARPRRVVRGLVPVAYHIKDRNGFGIAASPLLRDSHHVKDQRCALGSGKLFQEGLSGLAYIGPGLDGTPALQEVYRSRFHDSASRHLVEHRFKDESRLTVAIHGLIGSREPQADSRIETLDLPEVFYLPPHFGDHLSIQQSCVRIAARVRLDGLEL